MPPTRLALRRATTTEAAATAVTTTEASGAIAATPGLATTGRAILFPAGVLTALGDRQHALTGATTNQ